MDDKDSIIFDDIEIDLNDYGAAQASTMIDTLDTITLTGSDQYSNINTAESATNAAKMTIYHLLCRNY